MTLCGQWHIIIIKQVYDITMTTKSECKYCSGGILSSILLYTIMTNKNRYADECKLCESSWINFFTLEHGDLKLLMIVILWHLYCIPPTMNDSLPHDSYTADDARVPLYPWSTLTTNN